MKQRQERFYKALESQKLESLGILAGGVAHEFNNLLASILGNAGLAAMLAPSKPQLQECLTGIESTALKAANLCRQIHAYSERGKQNLKPADLNALAKDVSALLKTDDPAKGGVSLALNLDPQLPLIAGDDAQLRLLLMNLIANACEALPDGSGRISVATEVIQAGAGEWRQPHSAAATLPAGAYAVLNVSDTGRGMDAETQARILDPFFGSKIAGGKLGLAVVWAVVQTHKGSIKAVSTPGTGTAVRVLFHCAPSTAPYSAKFFS